MTDDLYEEFYNEDGTRRADPLTKVGIMLAIREMAKRHGTETPLGALEWALARKILVPRPGVALEVGQDDLILTADGQQLVAEWWHERDRRRVAKGKGLTLGGSTSA